MNIQRCESQRSLTAYLPRSSPRSHYPDYSEDICIGGDYLVNTMLIYSTSDILAGISSRLCAVGLSATPKTATVGVPASRGFGPARVTDEKACHCISDGSVVG